MSRIVLQLSPHFMRRIEPVIHSICTELRIQTARNFETPEADPLLAGAWLDGLLDTLRDDCRRLAACVRDGIAGNGRIILAAADAEHIVRAASAVRLRLRDTRLRQMDDADLETGAVDFNTLSAADREAYACYVFLAGLQDTLVQELDGN